MRARNVLSLSEKDQNGEPGFISTYHLHKTGDTGGYLAHLPLLAPKANKGTGKSPKAQAPCPTMTQRLVKHGQGNLRSSAG